MATLEEILKHDSMRHVSNSKKSDGLRCPARLEGMLGFELDRTVTNLIELEHATKHGKMIAKRL